MGRIGFRFLIQTSKLICRFTNTVQVRDIVLMRLETYRFVIYRNWLSIKVGEPEIENSLTDDRWRWLQKSLIQ